MRGAAPDQELAAAAARLAEEVAEVLRWERSLGGVGVTAAELRAEGERGRPADVPPVDRRPVDEPTVEARDGAPRPAEVASAAGEPTSLEVPLAARIARLETLAAEAAKCTACPLHEGRTRSVFQRGDPAAELAFVGEGPGFHEDRLGLPFVGPSGELLDRMIAAMGYARDAVYVCNVVKCRPPNNRTPTVPERDACGPFLEAQLDVVRPRVIVALGRCAAEHLGCAEPEQRGWRGRWGQWRGTPVMPTYHPSYLLRTPQAKRAVWTDLQAVLARLGREPPGTPAAVARQ
ncbi:MAG: uracil-DNA glycosylase [Myxococcales bacterium]|nr:uracil-DNA glycosylase [Myxococcales bacterium]